MVELWGVCVCSVGFSVFGTSVLAFFGERTAFVVVCGGGFVWSGTGRLAGGVEGGM
jgi:low affinity Fe/Cu permease